MDVEGYRHAGSLHGKDADGEDVEHRIIEGPAGDVADLDFSEEEEAPSKGDADGKVWYTQGKWKEASECWERSLRSCAYVHSKAGYEGDQLKELQQIELTTRLNLAQCYLNLSDFGKSIEHADKVLHTDPSNVKALYRKGLALRRRCTRDDLEEAARCFERMSDAAEGGLKNSGEEKVRAEGGAEAEGDINIKGDPTIKSSGDGSTKKLGQKLLRETLAQMRAHRKAESKFSKKMFREEIVVDSESNARFLELQQLCGSTKVRLGLVDPHAPHGSHVGGDKEHPLWTEGLVWLCDLYDSLYAGLCSKRKKS